MCIRDSEIIVGIRELLRSFKLHPYDEGTERGFLRHVLVRVGKNTGEILVTLVGLSLIHISPLLEYIETAQEKSQEVNGVFQRGGFY